MHGRVWEPLTLSPAGVQLQILTENPRMPLGAILHWGTSMLIASSFLLLLAPGSPAKTSSGHIPNLSQLHSLSLCSLNMPRSLLPQDLCTYCFHSLEYHSSWLYSSHFKSQNKHPLFREAFLRLLHDSVRSPSWHLTPSEMILFAYWTVNSLTAGLVFLIH